MNEIDYSFNKLFIDFKIFIVYNNGILAIKNTINRVKIIEKLINKLLILNHLL